MVAEAVAATQEEARVAQAKAVTDAIAKVREELRAEQAEAVAAAQEEARLKAYRLAS